MLLRLNNPGNLVLSGYSYIRNRITGDNNIYGMPPAVSAELTNNCNLNCPECFTGSGKMTRKRGFMDPALFKKVFSEMSQYLNSISLYFQGEPMMHPEFFSLVESCNGIYSIVSTNGHFLGNGNAERISKSGLSKLIVSLDGADQAGYSEYRKKGDFKLVTDGLTELSDAVRRHKSSLKTEIQFLVHKKNEAQIPEVRNIAKKLGFSFRIKSMQVINSEDTETWLPEDNRFRRYTKKNGEFVINSSLPNRCARLWFNPVITWDGKVLPCCFDKNGEYVMGDLNTESFREIWDGPRYRLFRKSVSTGREMIDICRNCTSGLKVR